MRIFLLTKIQFITLHYTEVIKSNSNVHKKQLKTALTITLHTNSLSKVQWRTHCKVTKCRVYPASSKICV